MAKRAANGMLKALRNSTHRKGASPLRYLRPGWTTF
jgi:hypothetical protein